jgi:hypothetical protein
VPACAKIGKKFPGISIKFNVTDPTRENERTETHSSLLKFNPMVQADIPQLSVECNHWRAELRSLRDEMNRFKLELQEAASHSLSKEQLKDVEHYHNQFQEEDSLTHHGELKDRFENLEGTISELAEEFRHFLESSHAVA